jgi:neurabin
MTILTKNSTFVPSHVKTIKLFLFFFHRLKAKIEYIEPTDNETYGHIVQNNKSASTGVIRDVYSGVADVAFNSRFMNKDFLDHNVETTISNDRDDLCIIVPTAEQVPVFHNLFRTFSITTWCTTIGSIIFAIVVVKLLEIGQEIITKRRSREFEKETVQNIFFTLFQTLMGDSLTRIPTSFVIRTFMSGWILYSFLLSSAFTGILITKLVQPKFENEIDTITQLHDSGLEIFVPALHASTINETLEADTLG